MNIQKKKVFIDTDPGHDDFIALVYACFQENLDPIGVISCHGNSKIEDTTNNLQGILDLLQKQNIPIFQGAEKAIDQEKNDNPQDVFHGPGGLDTIELREKNERKNIVYSQEDKYEQIKNLFQNQEDSITYIALGPLTNLSILLNQYPEIKNKIKQIIIFGGAYSTGNVTPNAEFNIHSDPIAAENVCNFLNQNPIDTLLLTLELDKQIAYDEELIQKVEQNCQESKQKKAILSSLKYMLKRCEQYSQNYCQLYDPSAILCAYSQNFTTESANVQVENSQSKYSNGATIIDFFKKTDRPQNMKVVKNINSLQFNQDLIQSIQKACILN